MELKSCICFCQAKYRTIDSTLVTDLIMVKYDVSADTPLQLANQVILATGSYTNESLGIYREDDFIYIFANTDYNNSGSKKSTAIFKLQEVQGTVQTTYIITSDNQSVKLTDDPSTSC